MNLSLKKVTQEVRFEPQTHIVLNRDLLNSPSALTRITNLDPSHEILTQINYASKAPIPAHLAIRQTLP